ncbi:MAG: GAF domain-containing protein [Candidatus Bathyarchaeia archaeon]
MKQGKRKTVVPKPVRRRRVGYQEKLLVLHSHALQLNGAPTREAIAEYTLNAMQSALGFDFADILFPEQGCLRIKGSRGMDATFLEIPLDGKGVVVKAARKKATMRVSDVRKEPAYVDRMGFNWMGKVSMLSELAVPVILDREAVAVLNVESKRFNAFSDEDQKLLETLGTHVGSAISRLRRDEALHASLSLEVATLDSTADGILVVDRNGKVTTYNRRFAELWRIPDPLLETKDDAKLLEFVLDQLEHPEQFLAKVQELYSTPEKESFDTLRFKDGRVFERYSQPQRMREDIVGRVWSFRDVTERKQMEEKIIESEEKYRAIVENSSNMISILQDGFMKYVNRAACEKSGWTFEEMTSPSFNLFDKLVPARFRALIAQNMARRLRGEHVQPYEVNALTRDGIEYPVIIRAERITFHGKPADAVTIIDISDQKRAEETLHRRAEELQALQATLLDITRRQDLPTLLNAIVERAAGLVGASSGGMYLCDPDRQEVRCAVGYNTRISPVGTVLKYGEGAAGKVAQSGQPLIIEDYRTWEGRAAAYEKDQPFRAVLSAPMLWQGQVIGVIDVLNDEAGHFTESDLRLLELFANHAAIAVESTQAQEQLQRRAEELAALQATVFDITGARGDLPNLLESIVERAVRLLDGQGGGLDLCDSEKRQVRCVVSYNTPHDFRGVVLEYGQGSSGRVAETGKPLIIDDYSKWESAVSISGARDLGAEISVPMIWRGEVTGVIQVIRESATRPFTESDLDLLMLFANHAAIAVENMRRAENLENLVEQRTGALRDSEAKYRSVVQNVPVVVWTTDQEWNTIFITPNVEDVFGYNPDQVYTGGYHVWTKRIHPDDLPMIERDYELLFTEGKLFDVEYRFQRTDGKWVWLHDSANKTYEINGVRYTDGVTTNITERKEIEERLRKVERLAAIGETAAMVGHDLRNPLQAISAASYVLEKKLTPIADEKIKEMLEAIENSVQYSDRIVDDLLGYSEDIQLELSETTPKSIARDALLHVKIPASISVLDLTSNEPKLRVDGLKFRRLFINLIKNAVESMPNGGKLELISNKSNNYVELKLSDTGVGIPENVLRELWKPLITTKPKGIGLGLAICKRIMDSHKGSISVDSRVGVGTTFTLKLPLTTGQEGADRT